MSELNQIPLNLDLPVYKLDCIYHDKQIPDACDLFGSADCEKCTQYVKK
jgi:hypothetical protein